MLGSALSLAELEHVKNEEYSLFRKKIGLLRRRNGYRTQTRDNLIWSNSCEMNQRNRKVCRRRKSPE